MSHTKEPWDYDADDLTLYSLCEGSEIVDLNDKRNARRIVACVNACAGIPIEHLLLDQVTFVKMLNERKTLKQQRDELLAALKEIVKNDPFNQSSAGIIARAAIANAEDKP